MSNADIIRLTEIKQYFLDPPHSFKLYAEAQTLLDESGAILKKYSLISQTLLDTFDATVLNVQEQKDSPGKLRASLIEVGKLISLITSR